MKLKALVFACALAAAASANAATVTNGSAGWSWSPFAISDTTTYGQVFATPDAVNTSLDSFTFWMQGSLSQAYAGVATWTGTGAGVSLWQSSPFAASAGSLTGFNASTGGLNLIAGQQYVAYFSNGIPGNSGNDSVAAGTATSGFAYDNNSGGSPIHSNWVGCLGTCNSLQYTMNFTAPVPEPETYAMLLAGLGLLGFVARRRKQRAA